MRDFSSSSATQRKKPSNKHIQSPTTNTEHQFPCTCTAQKFTTTATLTLTRLKFCFLFLFYCEIKNLIGKTFSGASAIASTSTRVRDPLLSLTSTFNLRAHGSVRTSAFSERFVSIGRGMAVGPWCTRSSLRFHCRNKCGPCCGSCPKKCGQIALIQLFFLLCAFSPFSYRFGLNGS